MQRVLINSELRVERVSPVDDEHDGGAEQKAGQANLKKRKKETFTDGLFITDGLYTKSTRAHTYTELIHEWLREPRGAPLDISRCLGGGFDAATQRPSYAPARRPPAGEKILRLLSQQALGLTRYICMHTYIHTHIYIYIYIYTYILIYRVNAPACRPPWAAGAAAPAMHTSTHAYRTARPG